MTARTNGSGVALGVRSAIVLWHEMVNIDAPSVTDAALSVRLLPDSPLECLREGHFANPTPWSVPIEAAPFSRLHGSVVAGQAGEELIAICVYL